MRFLLIFIVLCFANIFFAKGQEPSYKNYTANDGLASTNVYYAMQDHEGFIWFGTDNGVSRFDGTRFKNFTTADGLSDNDVLKIIEDSENRVWFLTFSGKLSFYKNGKIYNSSNNEVLKKLKLTDYITSFYEDSKKNIWISDIDNSLICISLAGEVKKYNPGAYFYLIWENRKKEIQLLGTSSIRTIKNSTFTDLKSNALWKPGLRLPGDSLLLVAANTGLLTLNMKSNAMPIANTDNYNDFDIQLMSTDNQKNTWICTLSGAVEFDNSIIDEKHAHHFFRNYSVTSFLKDKDNDLWFSTTGSGVFKIPSSGIRVFDEKSGLIESNITAFANLNTNLVMVGLHDGSIQLIENNVVKDARQVVATLSGPVIKITKGPNGVTLILTEYAVYKYQSGQFIKMNKYGSLWNKTLFIARDGTPWIGWGRGLKKIINDTTSIAFIYNVVNRVYAIEQGSDSSLILGTDKGLYRFKNGQMVPDDHDIPLLKHRIKALAITADSTLWIGTDDYGLLKLSHNKVTQYDIKDHLLSNHCNSLFADSNKIYIATNNGLNVLYLENNSERIVSYSVANGLVSNHINQVGKADKHTVILATDQGLVIFDERKLSPSSGSTPYINSVAVGDSIKPLANKYSFKPDENNVRIDYGAINFNSGGTIYYRYKLAGADVTWNYTTYTSVKYAYLHPGNYTFIVATQNADGSWNSQTASFTFYIQTPWWQTWWFRLVVGLSLLGMIYFIIRWRISVYKQKINRERALAESELKALRAQINPHFIYNSLNAIQDFILQNQKEDANLYLSKFASLMRSILSHSRASSVSLEEEIASLQLYLELETLRFNNHFTFQFIVDKNIDTEYVHIPSMILQPYIENAILHGVAPLSTAGKITISFYLKNNFLVSTIEDNGIGRKKAAEAREQRVWKGHKSLGMTVTRERIDLMSHHQKEKINMEITDLVDETNHAAGTRVTIYFPVQG